MNEWTDERVRNRTNEESVILGRLRQANRHELKATLGYTVSPRPFWATYAY